MHVSFLNEEMSLLFLLGLLVAYFLGLCFQLLQTGWSLYQSFSFYYHQQNRSHFIHSHLHCYCSIFTFYFYLFNYEVLLHILFLVFYDCPRQDKNHGTGINPPHTFKSQSHMSYVLLKYVCMHLTTLLLSFSSFLLYFTWPFVHATIQSLLILN